MTERWDKEVERIHAKTTYESTLYLFWPSFDSQARLMFYDDKMH